MGLKKVGGYPPAGIIMREGGPGGGGGYPLNPGVPGAIPPLTCGEKYGTPCANRLGHPFLFLKLIESIYHGLQDVIGV